MENQPQNYPPPPQDKTQLANGYEQYLDPGQKPDKKRKIIILIIVGLTVLVIISIVALFALSSGDKKQSGQSNAETVACSDEGCFESNFKQCISSEYTYKTNESSVRYKIQGSGERGCSMEMSYINSKYQPDIQGKSMVCDFDNATGLDTAVQNAMDYPDDYDCRGDLAEFLKISATVSAN